VSFLDDLQGLLRFTGFLGDLQGLLRFTGFLGDLQGRVLLDLLGATLDLLGFLHADFLLRGIFIYIK